MADFDFLEGFDMDGDWVLPRSRKTIRRTI